MKFITKQQQDIVQHSDPIDRILENFKYYKNKEGLNKSSVFTTNLNVTPAQALEYKIFDNTLLEKKDHGYKIYLFSTYLLADAIQQWEDILNKNRKILNNAKLIIKKNKDQNNRISFAVMVGNYTSLSQAKLICKELIKKQHHCIVKQ